MPHRRNTPELKAFVSDLYAPSSPGFLQFLSFNEWKTRFGPSDQDLAAIEAWAAAVGLRETHRSRANLELVFEADVKTVQSSFGIVLNEYEAEGRHFFSNDRDVVLPSPLRGLVDDVVGLESYSRVHSGVRDDLAFVDQTVPRVEGSDRVEHRLQSNGMPRASVVPLRSRSGRPATVAKRTAPLLTGPNPTWIEPTDLWSSWGYDYDALAKLSHCCNPTSAPGGSPKESSIAIVGGNKPQWSDVTAFYNAYGLAANVTQIEIWGPSCCSSEMTLDASYAGAMSNSFGAWSDTAQIFDYEGGSLLISDLLDAWEWAFEDDKARVLSSSFGSAESAYGSFLDLTTPGIGDFVYVTYGMASTGWTMLVAAGDDGETADCATYSVQYPGSDPNVITVGGTTLTLNAANGVFQSEYAWSGLGCPNLGGGGGGCSSAFQWPFQPPWQQDEPVAAQCQSGSATSRLVPDLSLNASTLQALYFAGAWGGTGGTSLGAPEMAGFFAQANSYLNFIGLSGNLCGRNHNLPCNGFGAIGSGVYGVLDLAPHDPYYDVTQGDNAGGGGTFGYAAGPGYDLATGLGSVNMLQLSWALNYFANGPGTTPPVITITSSVPPGSQVYATAPTLNVTIGGSLMGVAGFTSEWDADPGDPYSHATPGIGDPFYQGPQQPFQTSASFFVPEPGCHTLYIRAWDNDGLSSVQSLGPLCYQSCNVPGDLAPPVQCGTTCCPYGDACTGGACCPPPQNPCGAVCCAPGLACLGGACSSCGPGTAACGNFCCPIGASCASTGCCPPDTSPCGTPSVCCRPPP